MLTDSHSHLYHRSLREDLPGVLERARAVGVDRMVLVGIDVETSLTCFELADRFPELFPTAGVHPSEAADSSPAVRERIEADR